LIIKSLMYVLPVSACLACSVFAQDSDAQTDEETTELEAVDIKGRAQAFYQEKTTRIGSKTDIDILHLPQSAQVLTEQLIRDQAARDITDLYRSIAGVSEFSYSGVTFRGFRDSGNVFYDGVRGDPYSGFSVPQLFNVERVDVLKGPAAALYGGGEPGGMINYVTKKPEFQQERTATLTLGNDDTIGASVDTTGGVSDKIAYRLGAFYEEQDSFRSNADHRNIEVAGGLLFELSNNTRLTTTFDYVKQDLGGHRLRGSLVDDDGDFIVDPSFNTNEKGDFQDLEATVLQAILAHAFSEDFRVTTTLRYLDNERDQGYHEPRGWVDANGDGENNVDDGTIRREYRLQHRANEEISLTTDFVYQLQLGAVDNQILFGVDYHTVDTDYRYQRARYEEDGVVDLNVFNLNYGETDPSTYALTTLPVDGAEATRYGIYVQDQLELNEQWTVLVGLRYDHFKDVDKSSDYDFNDGHVSPRLGVSYRPVATTSLYVNYSESFKPTSLGNQEVVEGEGGDELDPETGNQIEVGVKNLWLDGSMTTTLAAYQINKNDVAVRNPFDTGEDDGEPALLNLGEVESKGAEFTLVGDLNPQWTITANYAYNDTQVIKGAGGIRNTFGDDTRFTNAPRHQAGVWTRYAIEAWDSAVAFGANYVSEQRSFDDQKVKPFTVFDMSWTTYWDQTELQVNVKNLFDEEYAVSGFLERTGHFPGAPREIVVQLTHHF